MLNKELTDTKLFWQLNMYIYMKYLELTQNKLKTSNEVDIILSVESSV